ncbi:cellulose synthase/poly-beta-1,6-N-acetylglucosamine synthase-like glycosyltransferase [Mucilaginibacter gracilis]|uniref:Cellulose synthase/poly-beta-1,6-N-acetylglucosamine synthase-like glycosyltransferase n=1 Tax=Mucilaginibacter gracilis TaxID=423350 RepID=A0A495JBD1_9SPHI|nr:glycosyltransferase [Mucilaginibacter gracilis]RKR85714.1 cellulose synthase/poly-beta-1,6-N-acetylglucosamine synthase-like glycosyltransferase [Mucilaginibacter gracilis]
MIEIHSIISLICTGIYLVVLSYLIKGWYHLKTPQSSGKPFTTKVTVLIAARNEEEKIGLTIDDILAQDYPKELFEIIIADDHSTDRTAEIISSYAHRNVKLLQLRDEEALNSYKKRAITEAIKLSTGDFLVATDADCRMGTQWLSSVVDYYQANNLVMISSPVTYFNEQSLFERMQTLEFSYLIGIGAAFIGNHKASTCNGANFAYRKDVFYEVGGFKGIDDLASGDDELLLQKVAEKYPNRIGFLKKREAIVYTDAKHTLKEFLQQRRRWASKSVKYKDKRVVALAMGIWLFNLSLLVNALLGFYDVYFFKLLLVQFVFKYLFEIAFLIPINVFFKRVKLVWLLSIISPIHVVYFVYVGIMGNTKKYDWKGRNVR